jgi:hypothetical protein
MANIMKGDDEGGRGMEGEWRVMELWQDKGPYLTMGAKLLSARRFLWR